MNPKDRRNQRAQQAAKAMKRKATKLRYSGGSNSKAVARLDHERRVAHAQGV